VAPISCGVPFAHSSAPAPTAVVADGYVILSRPKGVSWLAHNKGAKIDFKGILHEAAEHRWVPVPHKTS
jgi:hypothetical protein